METKLKIALGLFLCLLSINITRASNLHPRSESVILNTKLEKVEGSLMTTILGKIIYAFRELNYTEPPVGELGFKDPVAVKPLKNKRDVCEESPASIQTTAVPLSINVINDHHDSSSVVVHTKLGKVKGSVMKTRLEKDIYAFRGLNYAEPPISELRFKDPVPVKQWKNVRDATKEGPACMQAKGINLSEDCLTLNIYTKHINSSTTESVKRLLPVIVYLPPGIFKSDSAQSFIYGPRYLLDHDIVLVTVNYRLSTLGFINTGDQYSSGNYALKDQVVALQFVRDNIEAFGGDPKSVTLTGYSAGARSIILHMVSSMSKGLFHRAIALSGSPTTPIAPQKEQVNLATKQAELLNCTTEGRQEMFRCLREKPAKAFGNTIKSFQKWYDSPHLIWYPAIEPAIPGINRFLTDDPETLLKQRIVNSVPLIIGFTKDEFSSKVLDGVRENLVGKNKFFQELNDNWYELAPMNFGYEEGTERSKFISREIYKYYFGNEKISYNTSDSLAKIYANAIAHYPVYRAARLIANASSSPVYFYEFTYQGRYSQNIWNDTKKPAAGVAHADDLQYVFNMDNDIYSQGEFPIFTEKDPEFVTMKRLTAMWTHFAKTSEPLPKDLELFGNVDWKEFTPGAEYYLNIGEELVVKTDVLRETIRFWDSLFP